MHVRFCLLLKAGCRQVSLCSCVAQNCTVSSGGQCSTWEVWKPGFGSTGLASHSRSWKPAQKDLGSTNPANSHDNLNAPSVTPAIPSNYFVLWEICSFLIYWIQALATHTHHFCAGSNKSHIPHLHLYHMWHHSRKTVVVLGLKLLGCISQQTSHGFFSHWLPCSSPQLSSTSELIQVLTTEADSSPTSGITESSWGLKPWFLLPTQAHCTIFSYTGKKKLETTHLPKTQTERKLSYIPTFIIFLI